MGSPDPGQQTKPGPSEPIRAEYLELPWVESKPESPKASKKPATLAETLAAFEGFGEKTRIFTSPFQGVRGSDLSLQVYVNEFWTAKQRDANNLHEISYRACFKPQLPRFFIELLTQPGQRVYDPFMGRGTTILEAALLERLPLGCDVNPLSQVLVRPRLSPPTLDRIHQRLREIPWNKPQEQPEDLLVFYSPQTLAQLSSLRHYLMRRNQSGHMDDLDDWIAMVALNRLTGHSPGFFSVYTMPPNQAVSVKSQRKINQRRKQTPPVRDVPGILLKKSDKLLRNLDANDRKILARAAAEAVLLTGHAAATKQIKDNSVSLVVTSPPFLNIVDYAGDNWLRCWFLGIDPSGVQLTVPSKITQWQSAMEEVFRELHRVLCPGGHLAFEVGEVQKGRVRLEQAVVPCGCAAGLEPVLVVINQQEFTKTSNCWGVDNNVKGTNSNRIVVFRKGK